MANQFTKFVSASQPVEIIYELMLALVAAGYTIVSSGDGLSAYSSSGNVITGFGTGAGGLANDDAWFIAQMPGSNRQIGFQKGPFLQGRWRAEYSIGGNFTGGSAAVAPTASDGVPWSGVSFNAGTGLNWFPEGETLNVKICVQNSAPYAWWIASNVSGNLAASSFVFMDAVIPGTETLGDPDPYVFFAGNYVNATTTLAFDGVNNIQAAYQSTTLDPPGQIPAVTTYTGFGTATQTWRRIAWVMWSTQTDTYTNYVTAFQVNPFNANDQLIPVPYCGSIETGYPMTNPQWKGISSLFRFVMTFRAFADTFNVDSSQDWICLGGIAAKWDGSTPDF